MESPLIFAITWLAVVVQVLCALVGLGTMTASWFRRNRLVTPTQTTLLRISLVALIVASIFPFVFEVLGSLARGIEVDAIVFFAAVVGLHLFHRMIVGIASDRDAKQENFQ